MIGKTEREGAGGGSKQCVIRMFMFILVDGWRWDHEGDHEGVRLHSVVLSVLSVLY